MISSFRTWRLHPELPVSSELLAHSAGYPLIAQYLARRGFQASAEVAAYLDPLLYTPTPPSCLPGMDLAVERLQRAIRLGERICVWGDFDVDGQTATALLVSVLRQLGAKVRYHIPVRAVESHGILPAILQKEITAGLDLLLTCDTGISANQAVQLALDQGIPTIITDHHALPPELPPAYAVVSPRFLADPNHPLAGLPGVGVAYKLAEALLERFGEPQACQAHLDLVALGIVADVAPLTKENRYLLQLGLRQLQDPARPALRALLETADIKPGGVNEETIAFMLAPRLNAVGRLADANPMVEFFTSASEGEARLQAQVIEGLNAQRKLLTDQVLKAAMAQIERDPALLETSALVLSYPTWPPGVIGIIASRLVEYFHKPVVLLANPPGEPARGSARSIPGIDITQAIAAQAEILLGYGGHPMAAGLSIQPERIPEFRTGLSRAVDLQVAQNQAQIEQAQDLLFDGYLGFKDLSLEFIEKLERLAPFGAGNPTPILVAQNVRLESQQGIGVHDEHLLLRLVDADQILQEVIWWQAGALVSTAGFDLPETAFDLAYTAHAHDFKGQRSIQLEWLAFRPIQTPSLEVQAQVAQRHCLDYRTVESPMELLQSLLSQPDLQVWREGSASEALPGADRNHLAPAERLAVWTIPPGRSEIAAVLEIVQPQIVYFFGIHPGFDQPAAFMERLAGLVKFALRQPGQPVELASLAASLAHRTASIRLGLAWLEAKGVISLDRLDGKSAWLSPGSKEASPRLKEIEADLRKSLEETAAFRSYYLRLNLETLL